MAERAAAQVNPYVALLRSNRDFRRIWIGDIASLLGDWLNTIALYTLVRHLTGSPLALGAVLITKLLPFALASPLAGLLTDRYNRRRLMIGSDLIRAVVVLAFLLVDRPEELPLLYTLVALQMIVGAVFIPARSAAIPNVTSDSELLTANALSSATWSILLAVGAALGGVATEVLGIEAVFVLDAASYLVSAAFIWGTVIPQSTEGSSGASVSAAVREIVDGWRQMRRRPGIGRISLTKPAWSVSGGGLVYLLTLMGEQLTPAAPAIGIGLLYGVRGLGTGIGPILTRQLIPDERAWPRLIGWGLAGTGVAYGLVAAVPWTYWITLLVIVAHTPSGANWVMSTVLLQRRTEDRFRGRVFATEWLLLTLADSVSILAASLLLEAGVLGLRGTTLLFSAIAVACGLAWLLFIVPAETRAERTQSANST